MAGRERGEFPRVFRCGVAAPHDVQVRPHHDQVISVDVPRRVVINRQGAETMEEGISAKKAEEVIGKPIFWQVPNDPKPVTGARVAGQPLIRHAPRSRAQQSINGLARALYGKPVSGSEVRGSKWAFFGKR